MKRILITQRVDVIKAYNERRDALDQRWIDFLLSIDCLPVIVANNVSFIKELLNSETIDGILLSGGNSLVKYGGNSTERDNVDNYLLEYAIQQKIPLIGVCRGMQSIQDFFSNPIQRVDGHVAIEHELNVFGNDSVSLPLSKYNTVMAYHEFGSHTSIEPLRTLAKSLDGVVMSIAHKYHSILGLMWHPERQTPFSTLDQRLFVDVFFNGLLQSETVKEVK